MKAKKYILRVLLGVLSVVFWIAVWWLVALKVDSPLLLPAPPAVFARFGALILTKEFWLTVSLSIGRVLLGLLVSIVLAIPLAVLTARLPLFSVLLRPVMTAVRATPVAAFIILLWLWVGVDDVPTIITLLIALPVVWKNVETGILGIDQELLEMSKSFRVPLIRRIVHLDIPSVLPAFRASLQTVIGLGWKSGIAAEIIVRPVRAIGRAISDAKYSLDYVDIFAWTLTVVLLSLLIEFLFTTLLSRVLKKDTKTARKEDTV